MDGHAADSADAIADDRVAGDPRRYRYAQAKRSGVTRPAEQAVELQLRAMTGVREGPIPQEALDEIDGFWLRLNRPADFTLLARLSNLQWLAVEAPVQIDLDGLASTASVRSLHIEAPITDITALAALTCLTRLDLLHTRVTDLSPLAALTALDDLSVIDGPLADLSPLAGLRLSRLFVYRTQVTDLSPLAGMATLGVLGLAGCPVRDLSVVSTLPRLHHVNLHNTPVTDLGDLPARLPRVTFEGVTKPGSDGDTSDDAGRPSVLIGIRAAETTSTGRKPPTCSPNSARPRTSPSAGTCCQHWSPPGTTKPFKKPFDTRSSTT